MGLIIIELCFSFYLFSLWFVYELGDLYSMLWVIIDGSGVVLLIYVGGEIDGCNEYFWC